MLKKVFILLVSLSVITRFYGGGAVDLNFAEGQETDVPIGETISLELEFLYGEDYHDNHPLEAEDPSTPTRGYTDVVNSIDWTIEADKVSDDDGGPPILMMMLADEPVGNGADQTFNSADENLGNQMGDSTSPEIKITEAGEYDLKGKTENVNAVDDHGTTIPSEELEKESNSITVNVVEVDEISGGGVTSSTHQPGDNELFM